MLIYFSNCSLFRAKKLETNLKNGKVSFHLNINAIEEMEDSWPNGQNAIKTKIAFVKD